MANLDQSWVNVDVDALMERHLGRTIVALNDADATSIAGSTARRRATVASSYYLGAGHQLGDHCQQHATANTELGHLKSMVSTPKERVSG